MRVLDRDRGPLSYADVWLTRDELTMLNNALNEVCNGVHIDDSEFQTRLGWDRETLRSLLGSIGELLKI